jgi:hypothetical protein
LFGQEVEQIRTRPQQALRPHRFGTDAVRPGPVNLENAKNRQSTYANELAHSAIQGIGRSRWRKSVSQVFLDARNDLKRPGFPGGSYL